MRQGPASPASPPSPPQGRHLRPSPVCREGHAHTPWWSRFVSSDVTSTRTCEPRKLEIRPRITVSEKHARFYSARPTSVGNRPPRGGGRRGRGRRGCLWSARAGARSSRGPETLGHTHPSPLGLRAPGPTSCLPARRDTALRTLTVLPPPRVPSPQAALCPRKAPRCQDPTPWLPAASLPARGSRASRTEQGTASPPAPASADALGRAGLAPCPLKPLTSLVVASLGTRHPAQSRFPAPGGSRWAEHQPALQGPQVWCPPTRPPGAEQQPATFSLTSVFLFFPPPKKIKYF